MGHDLKFSSLVALSFFFSFLEKTVVPSLLSASIVSHSVCVKTSPVYLFTTLIRFVQQHST